MPSPVPVDHASLLGAHARRGAYTDSYAVVVPRPVNLPDLVEAFYTTRLFKVERWLIARALGVGSTDQDARAMAAGRQARFSAWTVEGRTGTEILLGAGRTRSWLAVAPAPHGTTLHFGSAVLPRAGGGFGWGFHALLGFHRLYSRALLAAAARRLTLS